MRLLVSPLFDKGCTLSSQNGRVALGDRVDGIVVDLVLQHIDHDDHLAVMLPGCAAAGHSGRP